MIKVSFSNLAVIIVSGCSIFAPPPNAKAVGRDEIATAEVQRRLDVQSRTSEYQERGMSEESARATAETDYKRQVRK